MSDIEKDKHGHETHPAFGHISASRVSQSPPGKALFDSSVRHQHYVMIEITEAVRNRDLHTDWTHGTKSVVQVAMSEAQWASFVSSMNTSGVPCTINWRDSIGYTPELELDSRLDLTHKEVREKTSAAIKELQEALAAVKEKPTKANIRNLEIKTGNLPANLAFAAKQLTEHSENVTNKVKADVEAFVMNKAQQAGLDPKTWMPIEELEAKRADEQPKQIEG